MLDTKYIKMHLPVLSERASFSFLLPYCNGLSKNQWSIIGSIRDQTTVTIKAMKYKKELFYHMPFSIQSFCLEPFKHRYADETRDPFVYQYSQLKNQHNSCDHRNSTYWVLLSLQNVQYSEIVQMNVTRENILKSLYKI